jgi:hypothetical protein
MNFIKGASGVIIQVHAIPCRKHLKALPSALVKGIEGPKDMGNQNKALIIK